MARPFIDVKDLEYFLAAYDARVFSTAAKRLGTVQSNVSARIGKLERRLGALLFERGYRKLAPTRAGDALFAASHDFFAALGSLRRAIRRAKRVRNRTI